MERKVTRHFVFFIQKDEFTQFVSIITGKYMFKLQNYSDLFCLVLIEIFGRYNRPPESDKELKVNYLLQGENESDIRNGNAMLWWC